MLGIWQPVVQPQVEHRHDERQRARLNGAHIWGGSGGRDRHRSGQVDVRVLPLYFVGWAIARVVAAAVALGEQKRHGLAIAQLRIIAPLQVQRGVDEVVGRRAVGAPKIAELDCVVASNARFVGNNQKRAAKPVAIEAVDRYAVDTTKA